MSRPVPTSISPPLNPDDPLLDLLARVALWTIEREATTRQTISALAFVINRYSEAAWPEEDAR